MGGNPKIEAFKQFQYFIADYRRFAGKKKLRMLFIWMTVSVISVLFYRIERFLFLSLGERIYRIVRLLWYPVLEIIKSLSNIDINYSANIGPGILILHSSLGIVISGKATIGHNLTLVGGNVIGIENARSKKEKFIIGNNVSLGANAVIIGPVRIGDNVKIGAQACVVKNAPSNCTLVGAPARIHQ